MTIDLGKSSGFALATQSAASGAFAILGYDPSEWDIAEASYEGVVFHVLTVKNGVDWNGALSKVTDAGGRRKAKFMFPYQDGQIMDDLGRLPETFSFEVLIFGPNYKAGLDKLLKKLQQPQPGKLIHPVRGEVRCAMDSFELLHASDSRNAVAIRLTMAESNLDEISYSRMAQISTFKSALSQVAKTINKINKVISKIQAAAMFYAGLKQLASELTTTYQAAYTDALRLINGVFNKDNASDLANILPAGSQSSSVFSSFMSPNDPFANIDLETLSKETVTAIAAQSLETVLDTMRQESNMLMKTLATMQPNSVTIAPEVAFLLGRKPDGTLTDDQQTTVCAIGVNRYNSSPGALAQIPDGLGALVFADEIKTIRDSVLALQQAYDFGLQSNRTKLVRYTTPRLMSIREVAFELGVDFEKLNEIDALNPSLESVNYIPKGTVVVVAI
jgi:hypothetical protein